MILRYQIKSKSTANHDGIISAKNADIAFGTTAATADTLPTPADLLLSAFAWCILKNIERFSAILKFNYAAAEITVKADRLEYPSRMDNITYEVTLHSDDSRLNIELLQRNITKRGTIYNTVAVASTSSGTINKVGIV